MLIRKRKYLKFRCNAIELQTDIHICIYSRTYVYLANIYSFFSLLLLNNLKSSSTERKKKINIYDLFLIKKTLIFLIV